jgi:hypothetical protein
LRVPFHCEKSLFAVEFELASTVVIELAEGVNMQTLDVTVELEQIARELGYDWGVRVREEYVTHEKAPESWPGTLQQARELVDVTFGAKPVEEERETLTMLVERGARRAWRSGPYR